MQSAYDYIYMEFGRSCNGIILQNYVHLVKLRTGNHGRFSGGVRGVKPPLNFT